MRFRRYIASLRIELHFRPSPTQVFDVVAENLFFYAPDAVEWEEVSFSVNNAKFGPDRPGLPLLQAEKVLTLPLDLRLTNDYRYKLERIDSIGDRRCYVVAFDPIDATKSRYRGWVWIDTVEPSCGSRSRRSRRISKGRSCPTRRSRTYEPVRTEEGTSIFLPRRCPPSRSFSSRAATCCSRRSSGSRLPDRSAAVRRRTPSGPRQPQHHVPRHDEGIRYLVNTGGERVVSDDLRTSSKAMAIGTTIDPSFAFPLPILGINYLNFDVKGSGNQFALLFGGVFIAGNLQNPKLGKTPFDMSIDFFGIAVPGTESRFDAVGERMTSACSRFRVDRRQSRLSVHAVSEDLGRLRVAVQRVFPAPDTAEDFVVPAQHADARRERRLRIQPPRLPRGRRMAIFRRQTWTAWGPASRPASFRAKPTVATPRRR